MNSRIEDVAQEVCYGIDALAIDFEDGAKNKFMADHLGIRRSQSKELANTMRQASALIKGAFYKANSEIETRDYWSH